MGGQAGFEKDFTTKITTLKVLEVLVFGGVDAVVFKCAMNRSWSEVHISYDCKIILIFPPLFEKILFHKSAT